MVTETQTTAADEREAMEAGLAAYEAGIADVLEAYRGAAQVYAQASAVWPTEVIVASSTSPHLPR